jgi:hypothetical protein
MPNHPVVRIGLRLNWRNEEQTLKGAYQEAFYTMETYITKEANSSMLTIYAMFLGRSSKQFRGIQFQKISRTLVIQNF